jgi:hypothetical protein
MGQLGNAAAAEKPRPTPQSPGQQGAASRGDTTGRLALDKPG